MADGPAYAVKTVQKQNEMPGRYLDRPTTAVSHPREGPLKIQVGFSIGTNSKALTSDWL